jgi:molybdopterin synthase catalytic subunit
MSRVRIDASAIDVTTEAAALRDVHCGAYASFEGWVRNHNEGRQVRQLEYEVYRPLALSEGERIVDEAIQRFGVNHARLVHREGLLELADVAVWVGVTSAHRDEAFAACLYFIDAAKVRLPIWKNEHYVDGDSGWVNCERCAEHGHAHGHTHGEPSR